jgi:hypothetical protein
MGEEGFANPQGAGARPLAGRLNGGLGGEWAGNAGCSSLENVPLTPALSPAGEPNPKWIQMRGRGR